jgi:hypothetical protein
MVFLLFAMYYIAKILPRGCMVPDRAWFYRALTAGWFSRQVVQWPTGYFLHTDERSSVTMAACRYLDALPIFTIEVLENTTNRK